MLNEKFLKFVVLWNKHSQLLSHQSQKQKCKTIFDCNYLGILLSVYGLRLLISMETEWNPKKFLCLIDVFGHCLFHSWNLCLSKVQMIIKKTKIIVVHVWVYDNSIKMITLSMGPTTKQTKKKYFILILNRIILRWHTFFAHFFLMQSQWKE